MNPLVYLAGPITGLTYDGADDWRQKASSQLHYAEIRTLNPLRAKDYLRGLGPLEDQYFDLSPLSTEHGITTRDRFDVFRCDLMVANFEGAIKVSIGTVIELGWADASRTPVVGIWEDGNPHDHGMVREIVGWRAKTLEEGLRLVEAILL